MLNNHGRRLILSFSSSPSSGGGGGGGSPGGVFSFADEDDQQQLTGMFFQASLLPYLLFLYFLSTIPVRGGLPILANFGFQYLLLFVALTIVSGTLARSVYDSSLANVDWMHGTSESLLTVSNVLLVFGLNGAMARDSTRRLPSSDNRRTPSFSKGTAIACIISLLFAAIGFVFVILGATSDAFGDDWVGPHSPLLGGWGNLSPDTMHRFLPWTSTSSDEERIEPINALSIPTWIVHFSSVYEYLFAMNMVWRLASVTGVPTWRGLTWSMLPLHASSICAVTHHFHYNAESLLFLVTAQAVLTFVGNVTCMVGAFRIAKSYGWTWRGAYERCCCGSSCCFDVRSETNGVLAAGSSSFLAAGSGVASGLPPPPTPTRDGNRGDSNAKLATKLIVLVVVTSYIVKYGSLSLNEPFQPDARVALALVVVVPTVVASWYGVLSWRVGDQKDDMFVSRRRGERRQGTIGGDDDVDGVVDEESPLRPGQISDQYGGPRHR